jgi:hypothetical protein
LAAIRAWAQGDDEFESDEEIVGRIFREMMAARSKMRPSRSRIRRGVLETNTKHLGR